MRLKLFQNIKNNLVTWGIPGLFIITFLDSAGVPIPGGPDALVMILSWRSPGQIPLIVLAAAAGSTLGCLFLYQIGRKGGDYALARFRPQKREWVKEKLHRNAVLAMMLSVMAPPPFPTKLFILAAGVVQVGLGPFTIGVVAGRSLRYLAEAYLGYRFGDAAAGLLSEHYPMILLIGFLLFLIVILIRRTVMHRQGSAVGKT